VKNRGCSAAAENEDEVKEVVDERATDDENKSVPRRKKKG
jgi:hypothetical protein